MLLQRAVVDAFGEFRDWLVIIFDNFLILAYDHADLLAKLDIVLTRANERNFFMKFAKTFLGFSRCSFFGYEVTADGYRMDNKRIQGIVDMPFPSNQKLMLSFLGAALFTSNFVPHFASMAAELHEMTVKAQLNRSARTGASKLAPKAWGPFEVLQHTSNDVHVKHCTTHKTSVIHIADAIPFKGSREEAQRGAMYDDDEDRITHIKAYRGEVKTRTTLEFLVAYQDGDHKWLPLSLVVDTEALDKFIDVHPRLCPLLKTAAQAAKWLAALASSPCPEELAERTVYVDLRYFGWQWYASRGLPDHETLTYVVPARYKLNKQQRGLAKMLLSIPLLQVEYELKGSTFAQTEGLLAHTAECLPTGEPLHVLVTQQLVEQHPSLLME